MMIGAYLRTHRIQQHPDLLRVATDGMRNYHGTKWARIESNRSAHVDVTAEHYAPSWIFNVISWMLFCTPTLYLKRLDEIWLDSNVNQRPWRRFISELKDDWAASITPVGRAFAPYQRYAHCVARCSPP